MITLNGKGVYGAIAIGVLSFHKRAEQEVDLRRVDDPDAEIARFEAAKEEAIDQLQELYQKALQEVGETNAMIFDIHQMMLEDPDYVESITNIIKTQSVNAEYAVATTAENFSKVFSSMDDAYMKERAADVLDISNRLQSVLTEACQQTAESSVPSIIAAEDLAPSETVQLDKSKVLGFVTVKGSTNSHTAILARTMGIPAVIHVGKDLLADYDGHQAVVDGFTGTIYIDPDEQTLKDMQEKQEKDKDRKKLLQQLKGQENITLDGQRVNLFANIGDFPDMGSVLQNDAGGIGLFRSEFLYLENNTYPTEDQQFDIYKMVAETMAGKKVIIRTLDIGADKQADYFQLDHEDNPAMGFRAIRICLERPKIFKTQLRALYRASAFGQIAIMLPMIISVDEVRQAKAIIAEVKSELMAEGIPFHSDVELGIMIETPASVLIGDDLAKEVDFFSVGTNDLTQYTLAIDRQNQKLDQIFDPHHKAVLRMIKMAADYAHANGIWIGICGELAADTSLTETFLSMGIDELSVTPTSILELRKKVRETNVSQVRDQILRTL